MTCSRSSPRRVVAILVARARRRRSSSLDAHAARRCAPPSTACTSEAIPLLDDAHDAVREAAIEVDRVDRLVDVGRAHQRRGRRRVSASRTRRCVAGREGDGVRHRRVPRRAAAARGRAARTDARPPSAEAAPTPASEGVLDVQAAVLARRRVRARARLVVGGRRAGCAGSRQRYAPTEVVDRWSGNVRAAVDEGRTAMRAREAELKASIGARGRAVAWT